MDELTLRVTGMSCMGCANSVKRMLGALDGVAEVDVDLANGLVRLRYAADRVSLTTLRQVVENAGFQVAG